MRFIYYFSLTIGLIKGFIEGIFEDFVKPP